MMNKDVITGLQISNKNTYKLVRAMNKLGNKIVITNKTRTEINKDVYDYINSIEKTIKELAIREEPKL